MISLGLAVDVDRIRAVLVRSRKVVWAEEAIVENPDELASVVKSLLLSAPYPRLRRIRVNVAIGPARAHVRRLTGLPVTADADALAKVVYQGGRRFFVKSDAPVLQTGVRVIEPGSAWACFMETATIRAITAGCQAASARLLRATPAVAVLGQGLDNEDVCWRSTDAHLHLSFRGGELTSLRRLRCAAREGCEPPRARAVLMSAGEHAWRFADAYGAAVASRALPLSLRRAQMIERNGRSARLRVVAAVVVFATATCSAILAPFVAATRAGRKAEQVQAALASEKAAADTIHEDLRRMTSAINTVAGFATSRRSITLLLRELATALPERTALAALRVDSAGGTIVALGPQAANVVAALERVALIVSPEISGPITRELLGTEFVERVTIQFRLADSVLPTTRTQSER